MQKLYLITLLLVLITPYVSCEDDKGTRDEKLISTFQIVRFPNDPCVGSNTRNGTCYTSQECSDKSGTSSGSCADGFGVCCTFVISTCGSTSSENLTSWTQASTVASGECGLTVCPIDDSICSLRIDFTNFVISGPSTISLNQVRRMLGHPAQNMADTTYAITGSAMHGNCLTDTFYMKSASTSTTPPAICGTATGEHMYLEADVDNCNYLGFYLADMAAASLVTATRGLTTLATRTWDMTITQIECTSKTLPPPGCTKYFWNAAGRAVLQSSNYQVTTGTTHLAQQHDRYCIRRERGFCVGCFQSADSEFALSGRQGNGNPAVAVNYAMAGGCCGYRAQISLEMTATAANDNLDGIAKAGNGQSAASGLAGFGWDCVVIPGAFISSNSGGTLGLVYTAQSTANIQQLVSNTPTTNLVNQGTGPQICGNNKGLGTGVTNVATIHEHLAANSLVLAVGNAANYSICTRSTPFMLEFLSDDLEGIGSASAVTIGELGGTATTAGPSGINKGFRITHSQLAC